MGDRISFRFLTLRAEAEGIRAVRIIAWVSCAGMLTSIALCAMWVLLR